MAYMKDSSGRRLDRISPKGPLCVTFGDSRTADRTYDDAANTITTNLDWFTWGQAVNGSGPVFETINAGIGGNTTTQMLARMDADVIAREPSHMTLWGGTNDGWSSYTDVDASFSNMVAMLGKAYNAGIYVFLISETTASTPLRLSPFAMYVQYYNDKLRAYAATHPNVEFWDFNSRLIDPLSTTGQPKNTYFRDGLHLNARGASMLGKEVVAPRLERFGTALTQLPNAVVDSRFYGASAANVITNTLMQGTGGGRASGHTGSLPDGWTSSGAPAAVCSVDARADGFGNDATLAVTASAASSFSIVNTVSPARLQAGRAYVVEAALDITSPTNLYAVSLLGQFFNSATPVLTGGHGNSVQAAASGESLVAMGPLIIRSRPFVAPAIFTSTSLAFTLRFAGAGSATVKLGRVAWKSVD